MRKITVITLLFVLSLHSFGGFKLDLDFGSGKKYFKQAEKLYNQGKYAQAIPFYQKFLEKKKNANNLNALYRISVCFMELGKPEKGIVYAERLYKLKGTELNYAVLYAEYLVALNRLKEAITVYNSVIALYPEDYLSYVRLGELYVNTGDLKKARTMWLKALKLKDKPYEALSLLSQSYLKVEKNKLMAYYYARKLYEISPEDKKPSVGRMLDKIAGKFKTDFENYYMLKSCTEKAQSFYAKGEYKKAFDMLKGCEELDNAGTDFFKFFAEVSFKTENYRKAVELYKKCLALGEESGEIYLKLAECYLKIGDKKLAKANLKLAANFPEVKEKALTLLNSIK